MTSEDIVLAARAAAADEADVGEAVSQVPQGRPKAELGVLGSIRGHFFRREKTTIYSPQKYSEKLNLLHLFSSQLNQNLNESDVFRTIFLIKPTNSKAIRPHLRLITLIKSSRIRTA